MRREWLYKATGAGDGRKPPSPATSKKEKHNDTSTTGCMSAIYNLFDVQHHQFQIHHPSFSLSESAIHDDHNQHSNSSLQGIEAPRNSLESPESAMKLVTHSSSKVKEQTNLNTPVSRLHIKRNRSKFMDDLSSQCCISPGTKTPNLVARLMGLDILPESRSLPATPRLSTASRRSIDNNDYHHRLSLQLDKENCRGQESRGRSDPKQIKNNNRETISRRFGTDITNTKCHRRDSNLVLLKPKKALKRCESGKLLSSPKLRLLDIKSNLNKPFSNSPKSQTPKKLRQTPVVRQEKVVKDEKIKRIASERYGLRLKKMSQQEKSTALANQAVNVKNIRRVQSFKKEMRPSSSTTKRLSQKQVSLPSNLNTSYNSNGTHSLKAATTITTTSSTTSANSCPLGQLAKLRRPIVTTATPADWAVLEWDAGRSMRQLLTIGFTAEVEDIVVELQREILGNLVHEIATPAFYRMHEVTCVAHVIVY